MLLLTKGQKKSKWFFQDNISSKKRKERTRLYYYDTSGQLVFIRLLEEIEDTKKIFQNKLTFRRNCIGSSNFGGFSELGGPNIFLIPELCLPNNLAVNTLSVYRSQNALGWFKLLCGGSKIDLWLVLVQNILYQTKRWFAFSKIVFLSLLSAFGRAKLLRTETCVVL